MEFVPVKKVATSIYDYDQLQGEQRLHMCKRAASLVPQANVQFVEDGSTGRTTFKRIIEKPDESVTDLKSFMEDIAEDTSENASMDDTPDMAVMQVLECPTEPKLHVYTNINESKKSYNLWAIVRESNMEQQLSSVTYEVLPAKSINTFEGTSRISTNTIYSV